MILTFIVLGVALTNINAKPETTFTLLADPQQETISPVESPTTEHLQAENELNEIDDYPKVIDVNGTIEEVEQILASNPDLPRLSRNEILSILENITTQDYNQSVPHNESENENITESIESQINTEKNNTLQPENYKTRDEYMRAMRALMLVLPFNAKNLTYSEIKELYTKAPITRIVGERPGEVVQTTTSTTTTTRKPAVSVVTSQETTTTTSTSHPQEQTKQYTNHHEIFHQPYDVQPILSSSNFGFDQETTSIETTEHSTTTRRYKHRPNYPHRRRRPTISSITTQLTTNTPENINTASSTTKPQTQVFENYHDDLPQQHYVAEEPDVHKEISSAQIYQATKVSPVDKHVTTAEPERTVTYKTTEQYYKPSTQSPNTTVYAQYTNINENYMPPTKNEYIKQNNLDKISEPIENQSQNQVFHSNRKRTKPPHTTTIPEPTSTTEMTDIGFDLPYDMKDLLVKFNVDDHLPKVQVPLQMKPEMTSIFVTPTTENSKILLGTNPELTKYSSQYSASELGYDKVTTEKAIMRDEVKELLASIGLFPVKGPETTRSTTTTTTTSTETPNIEAAAESFSPEMKDLLISFGLLPSANDIQHFPGQDGQKESIPVQQTYDNQAASPVIDPSSYLNFKPLPANAEESSKEDGWNSDMKQFLASFGLMPSASARSAFGGDSISDDTREHSNRSQKAFNILNESLTNSTESSIDLQTSATTQIKKKKIPLINMDMLNDEMKEVLGNLGFFPSQESFDSEIKRKTNTAEGHIFNPSVHLASLNPTEEEAERLSKLLATIKKLMKENGTISQEEIEALNASISFILPPVPVGNYSEAAQITEAYTNIPPLFSPKKEVNKSTPLDKVKNAPDPLSFEELMSMMEEHKNEVKRQQPNNETSSTIFTTTTTEEESTQDPGPSLTDLADSFGGGETASADTNVEEALPPKKPNGLYFLLDWNSFLQVEGDKRTINLQFTPKLGDSRAFQPVSVP